MPVNIRFEVISPPRFFLEKQYDTAVQGIADALEGPVAHILQDAMRKRTRGWKEAPDFKATLQKFTAWNRIALLVEPAGRGRINWIRNTLGTRPHFIAPRRRKFLRIRTDYRPHTSNPNRYGGPGTYGQTDFVYGPVPHPGTEARHYEEYIVKEEQAKIERELFWAVVRALP